MNGARDAGVGSLSATLLEHVDAVCDQFERAWEAGDRPRIEDDLAGEPEPGRSALLHELLLAELGGRRRRGEQPERGEYRERFPEHIALVDAAFEGPPAPSPRRDDETPPFVGADADAVPTPIGPSDPPSPSGPEEARATEPRFRILRPHAEGGLGAVYVARDAELNREVALKEIRPEFAARPESRARFLREAEITGSLEHPAIVPVYGLGRDSDGRPYYAMRFIRGASLADAIEQSHRGGEADRDPGARALALRKLLDRFRAVCEALAYAHSRGVLHRDVKPQNILVGPFGETFLVDWGLAKALDRPEEAEDRSPEPGAAGDSGATADGSALGTPAYMSPEQAAGRHDRVGPASDVYGLGATLYHLLTGRPAFAGGPAEVLDAVRGGTFPRPRAIRRTVPRPLEAICLKAMARRPEDRYATVRALADDVERWLADEPVSADREPWTDRARRWLRRHRTFVVAATAAVLLTAAVFGGCVVFYCLEHLHVHVVRSP